MKRAVLTAAAVLSAAYIGIPSPAHATPCQGVISQSGCNPAPWNGQQLDTWNIPGTYGGWTNGPVACDPIATRCAMWAQP